MSLQHAVLGFLQYGPRTGYELKREFDASVRHFWPAQQSQLYTVLASLTEAGWATCEVVVQTDNPNRKVYTITEKGIKELRQWLSDPKPSRVGRSPFLVRIYFSGCLEDEKLLEVLQATAEELRGLLKEHSEGSISAPPYPPGSVPKREEFFWYLTLDYGVEFYRFNLEWIEDVIDRICRKKYVQGIDGALGDRGSSSGTN